MTAPCEAVACPNCGDALVGENALLAAKDERIAELERENAGFRPAERGGGEVTWDKFWEQDAPYVLIVFAMFCGTALTIAWWYRP